MYHTISDIQKGDPVHLLEPIDNKDGSLYVGLRKLILTVGWFNINSEESFSRRNDSKKINETIELSPGLWSFSDICELIGLKGVTCVSQAHNGRLKLTVLDGWEVRISNGLLDKFGLDDGKNGDWLGADTYVGDRPMNLHPFSALNIHLDQLNTSENFENGRRSTLLSSIAGITSDWFGQEVSRVYPNPEFKRLSCGIISELKISLKDDNDNYIDNHGLSISAVLEFKR